MSAAGPFEEHRARLTRLAYPMLGSLADAEDVVQDAWLRWDRARGDDIADPAAWLVRATTRLCLDRLRAARTARETYVGPWLPEPLVEEIAADPVERAEEISVAFLLALQRLSPLERAVFLLREAFEEDYGAIARTLDRDEAACRQLYSRARAHVAQARPRFEVDEEAATRLAAASFMDAPARGDVDALGALLAEDCVMLTDGGGKRSAALRPLSGRDDILAFVRALAWRQGAAPAGPMRAVRINGAPGLILDSPDGIQTVALEAGPDGKLAAIYVVRNPDKLARISRA